MNMEDRLREAFDQEAEHLHAPSGSPETAVRRGRRRRASNLIGGATLILALVGGTAAGVQLLGDTEDPPEQDLAAAATETAQTDESATVDELGLETVDFSWEKIQLPMPADAIVWGIKVGAFGDEFVAIGRGDIPSPDGPGSGVVIWRSADGQDWELIGSADPFEGELNDVLVTDDGFVATGGSYDDASVTLYRSTDGVSWTASEAITDIVTEDQFVWFSNAASGAGVTVVAGVAQSEGISPPIILDQYGVVLDPPGRGDMFRVTDSETGEFITEISAGDIYGDGTLTVSDANGDTLMQVSQEEIFEQEQLAEDPGEVEIERDGMRLSLNYYNNRYQAIDVESGDIVTEGPVDDLYRASRVIITDPATGAVVADFSLEEFDEAEQRSFNNYNYSSNSSPVVLTSTDGVSWASVALPVGDAEELDLSGLAYGANGFVLTIGRYGRDAYGQETWQSDDGLAWNMVASGELPREGGLVGRDGEYFSLSYGNRGEAGISRSTDGTNWTRVFETDSSAYYLNELKSGGLGLVALGQQTGSDYPVEPITISKEGRTLVLEPQGGALTVTEDATGEVLLAFEFDVFSSEPPEQFQVDDETGTVTVVADDGTVLMVITEEDGEAATSSSEPEPPYEVEIPIPVMLVSSDGVEWRQATTDGLDLGWSQSLAVGDDAIVVTGESADAYLDQLGPVQELDSDSGTETAPGPATTLVGEAYAPSIQIWVGFPK